MGKTLVAGATGFIGGNLVKLLGEGARCLVRVSSNRAKIEKLKNYGAEILYGDVRNKQSLKEAVKGVEKVIDLVGVMLGTRKEKVTYLEIQVEGTRNLVETSKNENIKKFIYLSALGASPTAPTPFWKTKYDAEEILRNSGIPYTIFRPSFVHGQGDYLVSKQYAKWLKFFHLAPVPRPNAKSQPVYVDDLNKCLIKSLDDERTTNKTYEIGGPDRLTLEEFVNSIKEVLGVRAFQIPIPSSLARLAITSEQLTMLQIDNTCDIEEVKKDFSIRLTPFKEALKKYL